jgi:hypothetical protein
MFTVNIDTRLLHMHADICRYECILNHSEFTQSGMIYAICILRIHCRHCEFTEKIRINYSFSEFTK